MRKIDEKNRSEREQILIDKFHEIHPKKSLPLWFDKYANFDFSHNYKSKSIVMTVFLYKVLVLEDGGFWEEINGQMTPVHIHPVTGGKTISILWEYDEHHIFQARLNSTDDIEVLIDTEIDLLIQERYVENYR